VLPLATSFFHCLVLWTQQEHDQCRWRSNDVAIRGPVALRRRKASQHDGRTLRMLLEKDHTSDTCQQNSPRDPFAFTFAVTVSIISTSWMLLSNPLQSMSDVSIRPWPNKPIP